MSNFSKEYVSLFQDTQNDLAKNAGLFGPTAKELSKITRLARKYSPEARKLSDPASYVLKHRGMGSRIKSGLFGHNPEKILAEHQAYKLKQLAKAKGDKGGVLKPALAGGTLTAGGIYGGKALKEEYDSNQARAAKAQMAQPAQQEYLPQVVENPYAQFTPQELALLEQYYGSYY